MGQYLPIVCLLVLAGLFGALSFFASSLLAPRRPSAAKEAPYECGIVPSREPPERFPVTFYVVAMLFIMFDIELIFIYPFAVDREFLGFVCAVGDDRFQRWCSSVPSSTSLHAVRLIGVRSASSAASTRCCPRAHHHQHHSPGRPRGPPRRDQNEDAA